MTTLIEIICSVSQEEPVRSTVEAFCKETDNLLIGRRLNEETDEVLFAVQLLQTGSLSGHTKTFNQAQQQGVIASFRYMTCDLVKISFDLSLDLREQMRDFPLRPDESWYPAIHNTHQAYVCMSRPVMHAKQAASLLARDAAWSFV